MIDLWRHAVAGGAAMLAVAGLAPAEAATAQTAPRIPIPVEGEAAFAKREYGKAAEIIIPAFENCRAAHPQGDTCATLAAGVALLVATAGNDKVEGTILRALDYVDRQVGPDSEDALIILSALTTYYDRLQALTKYLPVAERRLAVSRKLNGATGRLTVIAAVGLCIAQWNLGQGQAAVDLLLPISRQLPETTPQQAILSGRVQECLGMAYYSMDRDREAEPALRRALALFERAEGESGPLALDAMASLANTLRRLDREDEARVLAARVDQLAKPGSTARDRIAWWSGAAPADVVAAARAELASAEKQYGPASAVTDLAAAMLAVALIDAGKFAEAGPYVRRLEAAANNPTNPASVRIKMLTGQVVLTMKTNPERLDLVVPVIERLVSVAKQSGAGSDRLLIDFQMYAGMSLLLTGQPQRAYPFLTDAGDLLMSRLASYRDFDAAAQKETRQYAPIFKFKVTNAWWLAMQR
ncbi:tetratricopeptide (TPR) repeat protein [Sphingomonas sp. BE123]|jgi:tetratricopeptide (TPR) repeat protein|uniref:tetratricopeptide repeat protein n=1 Tax=Sphingomonas sp. BE123 TaxID=2817842 RepID=UPI00285FF040|nr:tetratricopeptide repeat protein [Sphingomonas sp. BE123]MDR6850782.1 tetratricopeptide (TPR) repeat protein [Sphingomonas sp. BE123]